MKSIFKVKDAIKTVKHVFLNGLKQEIDGDFKLTKNSIKVCPALRKGEKLTVIQETTIIVK